MEELAKTFRTERLMLAKSVTWKTENQGVWFFSDETLLLDSVEPSFFSCLERLDVGADYQELAALVSDRAQLDDILKNLIQLKYIIRAEPNTRLGTRIEKQVEYFAAQGLPPEVAQTKIEKAHVAIVGLGGIGATVLQHLVAAGVKRYTLIDFDGVQSHNLNRQFIYQLADVGQPKVLVAAKYIHSFDPQASVKSHEAKINQVVDLEVLKISQPVDVFLLAADTPPGAIQIAAATFCHDHRNPFLSGGCGLNMAEWGPLITPEYSRQYLDRLSQGVERQDAQKMASPPLPDKIASASFGPANTVVAAFIARDIVHYLAGLPPASLNRAITLNYESLTIFRSREWFN